MHAPLLFLNLYVFAHMFCMDNSWVPFCDLTLSCCNITSVTCSSNRDNTLGVWRETNALALPGDPLHSWDQWNRPKCSSFLISGDWNRGGPSTSTIATGSISETVHQLFQPLQWLKFFPYHRTYTSTLHTNCVYTNITSCQFRLQQVTDYVYKINTLSMLRCNHARCVQKCSTNGFFLLSVHFEQNLDNENWTTSFRVDV